MLCRRTGILTVCLLGCATLAAAKNPWDLSIAERAQVRRNVQEKQLKAAQAAGVTPQTVDFSGAETPAAFTPAELFNEALSRINPNQVDAESIRIAKLMIEERIVAIGLGRDFWPRLEKIAAPVWQSLATSRRITAANGFRPSQAATQEDIRACSLSAVALRKAQRAFGRETFARFLYQGIAPSVEMATTEIDEENMAYVSGGCK